MHKNATKCNKTQRKWCINKHGASQIIDTFETYQSGRKQSCGKILAGEIGGVTGQGALGVGLALPRAVGAPNRILSRRGRHGSVDSSIGYDAHTIGIRMVWVECTTSAEYKSIRIVESLVMDGWNGHT
jgi:hypothetical protein